MEYLMGPVNIMGGAKGHGGTIENMNSQEAINELEVWKLL